MKMARLLILILGIIAVTAAFAVAEEKPWFDMENCSFCKCLMKDPMLLKNMTWEHYDIANGLLVMTTVKPEFKDSYLKAQAEMNALGQELAKGKPDIKMCGSCEFYGKLMMSGVKFEPLSTSAADIVLITSDKPEIVSMIKEYGKRNREELAKQMEPKKE